MMDSSLAKTIGLAAATTVITVFVARAAGGATTGQAAGTLAADSLRADSVVTPRWISDANVLAIVATMNAKQMAAADVELSAWHSDTVRALAVGLKNEHAELQRGVDSIASALHIAPLPSALNEEVTAAFQAQVDSVAGNRGAQLDRAFVRQQASSHALMASYLDQLEEVATEPALRSWLGLASARVSAQVSRLKTQQVAFVIADSVAADSIASRAQRKPRPATRR